MTKTEAEIFIVAVSGFGDCMSVTDVLKKYRDVTLQEALEDNLGEIAQYEESAALVESMWDLAFKKKTECKCPRCGSMLGLSATEDYLLVFCNTEGCLSYTHRLNKE